MDDILEAAVAGDGQEGQDAMHHDDDHDDDGDDHDDEDEDDDDDDDDDDEDDDDWDYNNEEPGLLNARDGDRRTPLMHASKYGRVRLVQWLVDQGAALDERDNDGETALHMACSSYKIQSRVVSLLVEGGGDPAIADGNGRTPLMIASFEGRLEVVRVLLGHPGARATVNHSKGGQTALYYACICGHGAIVKALLESGADPTIGASRSLTPVAFARDLARIYPADECFRECVVALEVRPFRPPPSAPSILDQPA
jgi:ankyrin repeat protein